MLAHSLVDCLSVVTDWPCCTGGQCSGLVVRSFFSHVRTRCCGFAGPCPGLLSAGERERQREMGRERNEDGREKM